MTRPTMDELRAKANALPPEWQKKYGAEPGTGPAGATCRSCKFKWSSREQATPGRHPKCRKNPNVTHGDATTVKTSTPACRLYEEAP